MNTTIIQQYIQFGIDNGFKIKTKSGLDVDTCEFIGFYKSFVVIDFTRNKSKGCIKINLIELITSKQFIEAVARGMTKYWCQTEDWEMVFNDKVKWIIVHQAKAIAEFEGDTLEDFIINLGT